MSGTGHGEPFVRLGVAARVSARMELAGEDLETAARAVIHHDLAALDGIGGLIAVDSAGRVATPFSTGGMFRGWQVAGGAAQVEIW